jgi:circadian clock protein KaiB
VLPPAPEYDLHLFVVGNTPKSAAALRNIQAICERYLHGRYSLAVVDVQQQPERAVEEGLLGLPCLVKKRPGLVRRLVGDLSDHERVLKALSIVP